MYLLFLILKNKIFISLIENQIHVSCWEVFIRNICDYNIRDIEWSEN